MAKVIKGALEAAQEALERSKYAYARRTRADSPVNDEGWGMYYRDPSGDPEAALNALEHYGDYGWLTHDEDAVDAEDIIPAIADAIRGRGLDDDYGVSAEALAELANPEDIVDSAGLWDSDPDIFNAIWEDVLEPRGITAVRTNDGLIRFGSEGIKPSGDMKRSAVGGGVLSGAMLSDVEASPLSGLSEYSSAARFSDVPQLRGEVANRLYSLSTTGDANPDVVYGVNGYPALAGIADYIDSYTKSPLGGSYFEGSTNLMRKYADREQATPWDYLMAALDVAP